MTAPRYCHDCGVVTGPYEVRCFDCAQASKPLANNCGVCGQGVAVTKSGVCGNCYEPKAPTPCVKCGAPVPSRLPLCWPCRSAEIDTAKQPLICDRCNKNVAATAGGTCLSCIGEMVKPQRPTWDAIWLEVADTMSRRSTCPRLAVGAVAVRDNQLLATAYNGAPRGRPHCIDVSCDMRGGHCVRAVHAEQNIVAQAAYRGTSLAGATLYTRHGFCVRCANLLIQAGIAEVVYVEEYDNGTAGALDDLRAAGITVRQWRQS
jgi:dCMP deaminase